MRQGGQGRQGRKFNHVNHAIPQINLDTLVSTYAELIVYSVFLFPFSDRRESFRAFPFTNLNYQINFARLLRSQRRNKAVYYRFEQIKTSLRDILCKGLKGIWE